MAFKYFLAFLIFNMSMLAHAQDKAEVLSNKSVIDLFKAGLSADIIISKIETSSCKFDMTTAGLVALKKEKLPDNVIQAMIGRTGEKPVITSKEKAASPQKKETAELSIDLMNHVYVYNSTSKTAKPLDKAVAGIRSKQTPFNGSIMLEIDGARASIRLSSTEAGSFAINTGGATMPELMLYKLKAGKSKREVASMRVTPGGVKTGENVVSLNITKLGDGIYQVSPGKTLEKGEYFFTTKPASNATTVDAYAFGVD